MVPFIIAGVGAGLVGIGKGIKAAIDAKNAKRVNMEAEELIEVTRFFVENARHASGVSLNVLGSKKIFMLDASISRFVKSFKKIKNFELEDSAGLNELNNFRLDKQGFVELRQLSSYASSIVNSVLSGALGGALAGFAAWGGATAFATVGTTAIASLHGVVATNATLAFFGGGSLAAGGLGVAGGTAVLGGLIAGPALAVMGFIIGAKAKANLDKAYSNYAEAEKISEELGAVMDLCNAIRRRSYLFARLLMRLDAVFSPLVYQFDGIIKRFGKDYRTYPTEAKQVIAEAYALAGTVKAALDTPILTSDGKLTKKSRLIASTIQKQIGVEAHDEPCDSKIEAGE